MVKTSNQYVNLCKLGNLCPIPRISQFEKRSKIFFPRFFCFSFFWKKTFSLQNEKFFFQKKEKPAKKHWDYIRQNTNITHTNGKLVIGCSKVSTGGFNRSHIFPKLLLGFFRFFLFSGKSHLPNFNFSNKSKRSTNAWPDFSFFWKN